MSDVSKSVLFTGHRIIGTADKPALMSALYRQVLNAINEGYTDFHCGGAIGFDTMAAECVLSYREKLKGQRDIKLRLVLPCEGQADKWKEADRIKHAEILSLADSVEYIAKEHREGCELERDRRMADLSSLCIAYCKRYGTGTGYTVNYCKRANVRVINLAEDKNQLTIDID